MKNTNIIKSQQNFIKKREIYFQKILKKIHPIVKKLSLQYEKLKKEEREILLKYKHTYYENINNYLINNTITFDDLHSSLTNDYLYSFKKKKNNSKKNNNSKQREIFNLMDTYNQYKKKLNKEIKLLDEIIVKYGDNEKVKVYRGIGDDKKNKFMKKIIQVSKKKGNILNIKNFQSTSLDIRIALGFTKVRKEGMILEIDTNGFPYFYLPWNIEKGKLRKEKINGSEFELLLQRNLDLEYVGKEKIKIEKRDWKKNWENFIKKGFTYPFVYLYKFKIVKREEPSDNKKEQKDMTISMNDMKNLFFIE